MRVDKTSILRRRLPPSRSRPRDIVSQTRMLLRPGAAAASGSLVKKLDTRKSVISPQSRGAGQRRPRIRQAIETEARPAMRAGWRIRMPGSASLAGGTVAAPSATDPSCARPPRHQPSGTIPFEPTREHASGAGRESRRAPAAARANIQIAFRPGQHRLVARPTGALPATLPAMTWSRQIKIDPRVPRFKAQFNEADFL
jgi:hypothetical protein